MLLGCASVLMLITMQFPAPQPITSIVGANYFMWMSPCPLHASTIILHINIKYIQNPLSCIHSLQVLNQIYKYSLLLLYIILVKYMKIEKAPSNITILISPLYNRLCNYSHVMCIIVILRYMNSFKFTSALTWVCTAA